MQYNGVLLSGAVVASATIISRRALIPFGVADAVLTLQSSKHARIILFLLSVMISYSFNNFI